jgi:RHS repeat-associated protein
VISSSETINAIAIEDARLSGPEASAAYTINLPPGLAITTNANGNITGIPPPGSSTNATFAYNNANRLASVTGTPMAATFVYDWAGQRYSKTDGGLPPTVYSYAQGGTLIAENNGGTVTDYVYADGRPIAIIQPSATPTANQINYVVADRLGTPQVVTNTGGAMVWKTTYQPYGTTGTPSSTITQNLRLPGQYADTETGFSYNLNRDYMPNLGRYLESDPAGLQGGLNLYAYELDNPLRSSDPTGLGNPPSHSPHTPGEPEYVRPNPYVGPVVCFIAGEIVDPAGGGLLLDLASGSACSNIWFLIDHALGNDWTCDPNYWRDFLIAQVQFPDLKVTSALQEPLRLNPRGSLDFAFGEVDNVLGEPSAPPCPLGTERTRGKCVSTR